MVQRVMLVEDRCLHWRSDLSETALESATSTWSVSDELCEDKVREVVGYPSSAMAMAASSNGGRRQRWWSTSLEDSPMIGVAGHGLAQ